MRTLQRSRGGGVSTATITAVSRGSWEAKSRTPHCFRLQQTRRPSLDTPAPPSQMTGHAQTELITHRNYQACESRTDSSVAAAMGQGHHMDKSQLIWGRNGRQMLALCTRELLWEAA